MINLNNPIHAVLTLIGIFLLISIFLFSLGFEFLGFLLILIYASGVAILFLFSVLFFNIKVKKTSFFVLKFNKLYSFFMFLIILIVYIFEIQFFFNLDKNFFNDYILFQNTIENFFIFKNLSQILYKEYFLHLLIMGFILFFVMLGILTLLLPFQNKQTKTQLIFNQLSRQPINSFIKIKKNEI